MTDRDYDVETPAPALPVSDREKFEQWVERTPECEGWDLDATPYDPRDQDCPWVEEYIDDRTQGAWVAWRFKNRP